MNLEELKSEQSLLSREYRNNLAKQEEYWKNIFKEKGVEEGKVVSFLRKGKLCRGKIITISYESWGIAAYMSICSKKNTAPYGLFEDDWHTVKVIPHKQTK